jgi:hypothetical protein
MTVFPVQETVPAGDDTEENRRRLQSAKRISHGGGFPVPIIGGDENLTKPPSDFRTLIQQKEYQRLKNESLLNFQSLGLAKQIGNLGKWGMTKQSVAKWGRNGAPRAKPVVPPCSSAESAEAYPPTHKASEGYPLRIHPWP